MSVKTKTNLRSQMCGYIPVMLRRTKFMYKKKVEENICTLYLVKRLVALTWSCANKWYIILFQQFLKIYITQKYHWSFINKHFQYHLENIPVYIYCTWMPPSSPNRPCITGNTMSTAAARCSAKSFKVGKLWARLQI